MAELLPEALAAWDSQRAAMQRQLADALADPSGAMRRLMAAKAEDVGARNQATVAALQGNDPQQLAQVAAGGVAPLPGLAQARAQLAGYQVPVFERLLAATQNPQQALEQTQKLTNMMQPTPTLDMIRSMLK